MTPAARISIVVPVLDEADEVVDGLRALADWRRRGHEVVVVDGGSRDDTAGLANGLADRVIPSPAGRAVQMNRGAAVATGEVLLFLHIDTRLPAGADRTILAALDDPTRHWGRFDVRLSGSHPLLRLVETLMNLRSRLSGIATGDQAIFVRSRLFDEIGGFPEIPLMEDIALSRRLKRLARPCCLRPPLVTSSRRWERDGIWRTIGLMWWLRLAYALGADPARLRERYYGHD